MRSAITIDAAIGHIITWTRRLGIIAVTVIAALMAVRVLAGLAGVPVLPRLPPLDQSTGVALAALAYVLSR
jgi:hypothetical protein